MPRALEVLWIVRRFTSVESIGGVGGIPTAGRGLFNLSASLLNRTIWGALHFVPLVDTFIGYPHPWIIPLPTIAALSVDSPTGAGINHR